MSSYPGLTGGNAGTEPMGGLSSGPSSTPYDPTHKPMVETSSFRISAYELEVVENANGTHFRMHWLVMK